VVTASCFLIMEKVELNTEEAIKAQLGSRRRNYSFFNLGPRLVWGDCEEPGGLCRRVQKISSPQGFHTVPYL